MEAFLRKRQIGPLWRKSLFRLRILVASWPLTNAFARTLLKWFPVLEDHLRTAIAMERVSRGIYRAGPVAQLQILTTLEQLDIKLAECESAARTSDDELRRVFSTFRMNISEPMPSDPFSNEYRDRVMALYQRVAGRPYNVRNEVTAFDIIAADRQPFPWVCSPRTAGFFLRCVRHFCFKLLISKNGARVVELVAGWGNSTIWMAMLGLDVTAVDIEHRFCELLERRAQRHEVSLKVVNDDFTWAERVTEPFDAAVFFESFHHCSDHRRLLSALKRAVKADGKVYFASEPIVPDFPVPWGLRTDGESLWAVRRKGWLELGFSEKYFKEALRRSGWCARKHVFQGGWEGVWEARHAD